MYSLECDHGDWPEDNSNAENVIGELYLPSLTDRTSCSVCCLPDIRFHRISKLLPTFHFFYSHQAGFSTRLCRDSWGSWGCSQGWSLFRHVSQYLPAHPEPSYLTLVISFPQISTMATPSQPRQEKWRCMFLFGYCGTIWVETGYKTLEFLCLMDRLTTAVIMKNISLHLTTKSQTKFKAKILYILYMQFP